MLNDVTQAAGGGFEIDRDRPSLRFERCFEAPPQRIWDAWTKPEQVSEWWDAMGDRLATCEIDLRLGGAFRFVTRHHPDKPFAGVYRQIAPPHHLHFEANGALGQVTIEPAGSGSRMTVEIICASRDHLEQFLLHGVADGTSRTLDNLVGYADGGSSGPIASTSA